MDPVAKSRSTILIGATAAMLVILHLFGALTETEAWLMDRLELPELRLAAAARSFKEAVSRPFRLVEVSQENERLREERDLLLVEAARLREAEDENGELRAILGFSERASAPPIIAHVIARTPEAGRHAIMLDRGADDGVTADMPVIVGDGIIVGKILRADRASSVALLLTDARSRVGASILNAGRTQGVAQGQRGLSLEMRLIPQNEEIGPGDIVVTSGIEPSVPAGLVIGRVRDVDTEERDPFKVASIVTPVEYDRIEIVALFPLR